ncbi:hypothetical protein F2Q70_00031149 [Brassica cretica]|uniref:Uncharacterized protein n=1 Tax=Brassica cretica TaxID=69181 RepID=A0A8S9FJV3_BRACR|nr:hypothetical protein F2Q70_00031149 [Brassica cretica]
MEQKLVQDTMQSMLLKEAKPVVKVSHQGKYLTPLLDTSADVFALGIGEKNESYMLTEVRRKEPDHKLSHEPPHKWKPKIELSVVQMPRLKVCFSDLKTSKTLDYPGIMHLSLPKSFHPGIRQEVVHNNQGHKLQRRHQTKTSCPKKEIILQLVEVIKKIEKFSVCKEESFKEIPPDNLLLLGGSTPKMVRTEPNRSMKDHPLKKRCNAKLNSRGVILSCLLKEEPPDAQSIPKPKQYQGHTCTKIPYLTNQEGLNHEDNFYGFYTQEGVHANWNRAKVFTEKEVMNFTSQRFLSPSIYEYPTLKEDSRPMKKRPEPKPIKEVNRSL